MARFLTADQQPAEVALTFARGEHHNADETAIPAGYARRAVNFDVTASGSLVTRPGVTRTLLAGGHSMYTSSHGDTFYVTNAGQMVRVVDEVAVPILTPSAAPVTLTRRTRVWWAEIDSQVVYSNGYETGVLDASLRRRPLGIPNDLVATVLPAPDRQVMVVWVDDRGEESGAVQCDVGYDSVAQPGFVRRLYAAEPGSGVFRRVTADGTAGALLQTRDLVPLPPGKYLTGFMGRLWAAVDRSVVFSNALRPGLYDPAYNFIDFPAAITAIGRTQDGLYVGTDSGMWFLSGADPDKMDMTRVSPHPVFSDSQAYLPFTYLDANQMGVGAGANVGAAFTWLTEVGPAFGYPGGLVRTPISSAVSIAQPLSVYATAVPRNGFSQLIYVVDSNPREAGAAVDSLTNL